MRLSSILKLYEPEFDFSNAKIVRHQDNRSDFDGLLKHNFLEEYQSYQSKPVFHECQYIISFIKDEGTRSLFYGVYKVDKIPSQKTYNKVTTGYYDIWLSKSASDSIDHSKKTFYEYKYDLTRIEKFDDLRLRLVIDWGKAAISWHQWATNEKEVIALYPKGYVKDFPGFLDFVLSYEELKDIVENPIENKIWHQMLSSVFGIYLIQDTTTGMQYVGSAYNTNGILGRWSVYANNGHGGNRLLVELLAKEGSEHKNNFKYTILRTLPKTYTPDEVIKIESLYKEKLGSRVFGLNAN